MEYIVFKSREKASAGRRYSLEPITLQELKFDVTKANGITICYNFCHIHLKCGGFQIPGTREWRKATGELVKKLSKVKSMATYCPSCQ
jgi:endonuclease IV